MANTTARFSYPSMTRALQFEDDESDVVQGLFFYIKSQTMLQLPNGIELITAASPLMDRESAVLDSHSSKNETFRIGMQCLGGCQSFPRALEETRVDGFFSLHLSSQRPPAALYRSFWELQETVLFQLAQKPACQHLVSPSLGKAHNDDSRQ